ncbi:MAG: metalloregulator ArsR/SmtB family transcription factor [Alphaproteobacteria bacterium]|jgi:ArsR family transcriptional regulator|nr:metalloregulator ArsR/SmtB family transcription factor [Alphaproteobacteria bacterium]
MDDLPATVDSLTAGLRAAGEATRIRLMALLAEGELTVSELTQILGQSQPRVSRHLKLMVEAGLLERLPEGAWAFYRLAQEGAGARLARTLNDLMPRDDATLGRDRERLVQVKAARAEEAAAYFRANAERWNEIRSLYVDEREVEQALVALFGPAEIGDLVDIGTGTGRILALFADRIARGLGVDMSHEMLKLARANLERQGARNCQVRHGDMYHLPCPPRSADAIVVHQVLHFATDPAAAIAEAARVLKPAGRLVVVDFAPHDLEFLREQHAHRRLGFADGEVAGWFRAAGLEPALPQHLAGGKLTVGLWPAVQREDATR